MIYLTDQETIAPHLLQLVHQLLGTEADSQDIFRNAWGNGAYALRNALKTYTQAMSSHNAAKTHEDSRELTRRIIQKLWWSESTIESLLDFVKNW